MADTCPVCKGTGVVRRTSFVNSAATIESSCGACKGKGTLPTDFEAENDQLRARIATLEKDNGDLILDNSRYVDDNTKLLNEVEALRTKLAAAVSEEREACAMVCQDMWQRSSALYESKVAGELMRRIRARSESKEGNNKRSKSPNACEDFGGTHEPH